MYLSRVNVELGLRDQILTILLFYAVTLGGATLFVVFGIVYLYESFFGGDLDLSPITTTIPEVTLPPQALAAMKQPYKLDDQKDVVAQIRRAIDNMYDFS